MIWREPPATTEDYPGLIVHDGRVTGSITIGHSRLPLWAIVGALVADGWDGVLRGWDYIETEYGFDGDDVSMFLYFLLECRGEFGRLLCVLANAERLEQERQDMAIEEQAPGEAVVKIALTDDDDGVRLPAPWWDDAVLKAPVVAQLRRCLATLED